MNDDALRLRAMEPADVDFAYRLESQPDVWRVSWGDAQVSRMMLWEYANNYTADVYRDRQLRLVADVDGEAVGLVDISDFDPKNGRAMVGIVIDSEHRRRGYALRALAALESYCGETLGMHQLSAIVAIDNDASLALFKKAAYKPAGKLRSWLRRGSKRIDALVFQKMLRP